MNRRYVVLGAILVLLVADALLRDRYDRTVEVHLDVLGGMVEKVAGAAASGARPEPNDLTELIYPLQRAQGFLRDREGESGRSSYPAFAVLVDHYETFVTEIDEARGSPQRWEAFRPNVAVMAEELRRDVAGVRRHLAADAGAP